MAYSPVVSDDPMNRPPSPSSFRFRDELLALPKSLPGLEVMWSVTVSDCQLTDCPLIGCTQTFEMVSGYAKSEIVGRNCRFLNQDCDMHPGMRAALRKAVSTRCAFVGILLNEKKDGTRFKNLLLMNTITANERNYMVGIQADISYTHLDLDSAPHITTLQKLTQAVFTSRLPDWVQSQALEFSFRFPPTMLETHEAYGRIGETMVKIGNREVSKKNTFLHVEDPEDMLGQDNHRFTGRQRSKSAPDFCLVDDGVIEEKKAVTEDTKTPIGDRFAQISLAEDLRDTEYASSDSQAARSIASSDEARVPEKEPLSIGSVNHPHNCTECQFHFFKRTGCLSGKDCKFCHEVHPRKNGKKNRKLFMQHQIENGENGQAPRPGNQKEIKNRPGQGGHPRATPTPTANHQ